MADLAKLVVRLEAESLKLQKDLDQAKRKISGFEKAANKSTDAITKSFAGLGKMFAAGAVVAGLKSLVTNAAQAGAELDRFSMLAGSSTAEFQKWGYAVSTVGISNEKLADILKDVNDKVGDFMQTGAGPLADFFENIAPKVGVTAKQFQGLSGQQALGLYVQSLEKANVSQAEMTFFMEAIANDASLLAPLLKDGGARMNELATEAERLGLVLSSETIAQFKEFQNQLTTLDRLTANIGQRMAAQMVGPLSEINGLLIDFAKDAKAADTVGAAFGVVLKGVATVAIAVSSTIANLGRAVGGLAAAATAAASGEFSQAGAIIDAFTSENEAAAAEAERRITDLWSGAYANAGRAAADIAYEAGGKSASSFNKGALDAAKAQGAALKSITDMVAALRMQVETYGEGEGAVIRYRLAHGDLVGTFAAAGAAGEQYRTTLVELTDALEAKRKAEEATAKHQQVFDDLLARGQALMQEMRTPLEAYQASLADLDSMLSIGAISQETYNRAVAAAGVQFEEAKLKGDEWAQATAKAAENAAQSIQSSLADFLFDPFQDGLDGMLNGFVTMLRRMGAELLASELMKMAGASGGGLLAGLTGGGGGGGLLSGLAGIAGMFGGGGGGGGSAGWSDLAGLIPARANGGPVVGGQPYLVGERGPELVVPSSSGQVLNTRETSALGGNSVNVTVVTPDADSFRRSRRQVANAVKRGVEL